MDKSEDFIKSGKKLKSFRFNKENGDKIYSVDLSPDGSKILSRKHKEIDIWFLFEN